MFIMRNSNRTHEKITGVLVGLVLSALCVTPAFAAGTDVADELLNLSVNLILIAVFVLFVALCLFMFLDSL